jgi:hypothetical protein
MLTEAERRRYEVYGLVFPIRVLTPNEAQRYRAACDELEASLGGRPRTVEVRQMHLHFPWAYELATHPRVLDAVEDLLGPDLLVWATELFAKHPQDTGIAIGWHRDRPYMGFDSGRTVTAWIALSESTPANGCLRAVRGLGRPALPSADEAGNASVVDVVLAAGEMSLHDPDILHGSAANRSDVKRVGLAVRYVTPDARPRHGRPPVLLARGRDDLEHCCIVGPPAPTGTEQALGQMKESAARHFEVMLQNLRPR